MRSPLDLLAQAEHGDGRRWPSAVTPIDAGCSPRCERAGAAARGRRAADLDAALAFAEAFAPEHLQLAGRGRGGARAAGPLAPAACSSGAAAGTAFGDYVAGSNHTLPTGGAARFASGLTSAHFRRRMAEVRIGAAGAARWRAAGVADRPRPRASPCTRLDGAASESARREPHRRASTAGPARPTSPSRLGLDGTGAGTAPTGVGFLDHMLDLLARHGRLDLDVEVTGDLETGAHHTVEDTGIVLGQALDQALGDRAGIRRYGHAVVPMDEARAACAIDISGRPFAALRPASSLPPGDIGGFEHELAEEFFRAVASRRPADAAPRPPGRHERPPHDRGVLQGVRPRAARRGRDRPDGDRRAVAPRGR